MILLPALLLMAVALALLTYVGVVVVRLGIKTCRRQYLHNTARDLDDLYLRFRAEQYLYLSLVAGAGLALVTAAFTASLVAGVLGAAIGFALPQAYLRYQKQRRTQLFDAQIVDTLALIANVVKAGTSIRNSLKSVVQEMPPPTSQEYALVDREVSLGTPFMEAFGQMCRKLDNPDLAMVYNALSIASKTGGDLAEMLDNISRTIRDRKEMQEKVRSMTAQGKMQGWLIGLMPAFLLLVLNFIKPDLVAPLFHTPIGWGLLALVAVLEALGVFFIRKVIAVDV
jgi:tight adherence protein B